MAMVINTNVASLNAQRNLSRSEGTLNQAMERLSTGLRINSAKDDAAGLAISTRFTTQIRGLDQAVRNANDGISLAQTGEAALSEITNNLQRIRELAVQSANATNSSSDREALDAEVQQRLAEISRIGSQTTFNGQRILDGSFGTATFQVGANVGETIDVNLNSGMKANQIGQIATATGTQVTNTALTEGGLTIQVGNGDAISIGASSAGAEAGQTADSAYAKVNAINEAGITGLTATATNEQSLTFASVDGGADYSLTINGEAIYTNYDQSVDGALTIAAMADQINLSASDTGVRASVNGSELVLTAEDGRNISITETKDDATDGITSTETDNAAASQNFGATGGVTANLGGTITLSSSEAITLGGSDEARVGFTDNQAIAVDSTTLDTMDITSVTNAEETIQRVDAALGQVSSLRSDFGAVQNRFESTIVNLTTISENLSASRSRIEDADFAAETAKLTKGQILQQAGVSILAQANQRPQSVLSLLQ